MTQSNQNIAAHLSEVDAKPPGKNNSSFVEAEGEWAALGTLPISIDSPSGSNIRLEDDFERIELELTKLESLTNEEPLEWDRVVEGCRLILKNQSKDLLVASFLTRALCDTCVLNGLLQGLTVNLAIVKNHWDHCFPPKKRKKGRAAAFEWLVEKCYPLLDHQSFVADDAEKLKTLTDLLAELDALLLEKLGDDAPSFAELQQGLKRQLSALEIEQHQKARQNEKQESPRASSVSSALPKKTSGKSAANPVQAFSGSISSDRDLQSCYRSTQDALRAACEFLRHESIANAEAYRINRFLTWLGVSQLPPATNGLTQLRPPPKEKLQHYQSLETSGKIEELVPEVENSISRSPYWLDGHRIVHECLVARNYIDAALAVVDGVRSFVGKFPDVINLKFSDQSAFASDATKNWIKLEVMSQDSSTRVDASLPLASEEMNAWEAAYADALKLFKEKKLNEAFAVFKAGCSQAYSKRSLTFWRFYQARFCFETQQIGLAIALLESVDKSLCEGGIESWEPDVSAKVLELLIRAYKQQPENETPKERVALLHERLCQFDLATAYELSTK